MRLSFRSAGTDQSTALTSLSLQSCTFTFPDGAIDLATDVSHGTIGVYTPGVYCTTATSAASIGTAGITLNGAGTYIFRINGALTTVVNSVVSLSGGASPCDVFWTPSSATTLGANSTFLGTDIDAPGITIGNNVGWVGRALSFGGTVTTAVADVITAPTCASAKATLHVIKTVINNNGGVALASSATIHVKNGSGDVTGSPQAGTVAPGSTYTLNPSSYTVSEDAMAGYAATFSGDCNASGQVTLVAGDNKTCTVTNDDIAPIVAPVVPTIVAPTPSQAPTVAPTLVSPTPVSPTPAVAPTVLPTPTITTNTSTTAAPTSTATPATANSQTSTPSLPNTGFDPNAVNYLWQLLISMMVGSYLMFLELKKQTVKVRQD